MRHLMKASAAAVALLVGCGETGAPSATGDGFDAVGVGARGMGFGVGF